MCELPRKDRFALYCHQHAASYAAPARLIAPTIPAASDKHARAADDGTPARSAICDLIALLRAGECQLPDSQEWLNAKVYTVSDAGTMSANVTNGKLPEPGRYDPTKEIKRGVSQSGFADFAIARVAAIA